MGRQRVRVPSMGDMVAVTELVRPVNTPRCPDGQNTSQPGRALRRVQVARVSALLTHTPSLRAERSNPDCLCGKTLDCFAPFAMTMRRQPAPHSALVPWAQRFFSGALQSRGRCRGGECGCWVPDPRFACPGHESENVASPLREERDLLGLGHAADRRERVVGRRTRLLQHAAGEDGGAERGLGQGRGEGRGHRQRRGRCCGE